MNFEELLDDLRIPPNSEIERKMKRAWNAAIDNAMQTCRLYIKHQNFNGGDDYYQNFNGGDDYYQNGAEITAENLESEIEKLKS